jgi:tryptophanase
MIFTVKNWPIEVCSGVSAKKSPSIYLEGLLSLREEGMLSAWQDLCQWRIAQDGEISYKALSLVTHV